MGVDYAWEKFNSEIRFALVSDTSLQERLTCLISGVSSLQRDSFPDEHVWDDFRKLVNETQKRQLHMSDKEAKERLHAAFDIFSQVAKAYGRDEFVI